MSGIVGIYNLDGRPVDSVELARAHQQIAHRGPDGGQCWHDGPIGLGHQLLCTTPESLREDQPLEDADRALVLTADARIDNRSDLIRALGWTGRRPASITDADLILGAYKKWGTDCPEHLLGAFAFAIWDARERRLFCARDHMGIKPFYYAHRPGRLFAFATEIKALLCQEAVPVEINEVRIADYLAGILEDQESTFYQSIRRLPPAHTLQVAPEKSRTRVYWALDPEREIHFDSDEAYAARFKEIFTEAVRCRLRSTSPIGTSLSGGLDSSSVTCVARDLLEERDGLPLHSFSAIFPDLPEAALKVADEREYMSAVVEQGGITHHTIRADELSPLDDFDAVLHRHDQPFEMRNVYIDTALYERAHAHDVRVMLDGLEGDLTVSHGYGHLGALAQSGDWLRFAQELEALAQQTDTAPQRWLEHYGFPDLADHARSFRWGRFLKGTRQLTKHFDLSWTQILKRQGLKPFLPDPVIQARRALLGGQPELTSDALLHERLSDQTAFAARKRELDNIEKVRSRSEREEHSQALHSGYVSAGTEISDRNAAAFAIEPRHPFYDKRLVEYCLALPPQQKLWKGWNRIVVRRAMKGILPDAVRWRAGKGNLSPNFLLKLHRQESARLNDLLKDTNRLLASFVDLEAARAFRQRGKLDMLWPVIVFGHWLPHIRTTKQETTQKSASPVAPRVQYSLAALLS